MYSSLQEQASIASNSVHLPDTNGNMDASELLKEKVCSPLSILSWNIDSAFDEKFLVQSLI